MPFVPHCFCLLLWRGSTLSSPGGGDTFQPQQLLPRGHLQASSIYLTRVLWGGGASTCPGALAGLHDQLQAFVQSDWGFSVCPCNSSSPPCPCQDQVSKDKALQSMASMSSAQIVSASVLQNKLSPPPPLPQAVFSAAPRVRTAPCPCTGTPWGEGDMDPARGRGG